MKTSKKKQKTDSSNSLKFRITKTKLLIAFIGLIYTNTYAQFTEHVVAIEDLRPTSLYIADIDGDGKEDLLSSFSGSGSKIGWYKNEGQGNFGDQQIITLEGSSIKSVYAADLDGDGDLDVLSTQNNGHQNVAWYKNDGQGNFGDRIIITTDINGGQDVFVADLDGDGDLDVISASHNKIAWYKNDGHGNFGEQRIITTRADNARSVFTADLDGDGDLDILSASSNDDKIAWYKNDGQGNFGEEQIITTNADGALAVYAADLDGDGDVDVLSASRNDDKIAWYKNDGHGNFSTERIITINADKAADVYAADIDGDGLIDVISASENNVSWYKNSGNPNLKDGLFSSQHIISTDVILPWSVNATDVDGDGDIDVFISDIETNEIIWYENTGTLTVDENTLTDFSIYPVPTDNILNVSSKTNISTIEIYNNLGQLVLANSNQNTMNVSNLSHGFYFCKVKDENGDVGLKKVIKQ